MIDIINRVVQDKDKAELILMDIELHGMLPPERNLPLKDIEALRSWSVVDNIKAFYSWEKE